MRRLKERIEALTSDLDQILGNDSPVGGSGRKGRMNEAGRARVAAAQRARWGKMKGKAASAEAQTRPERKMSAADRARIAAAAKARWAKVKAAGKNRL